MKHLLDKEGCIHFEWTNGLDETDGVIVAVCLENSQDDSAAFTETDEDVTCAACLMRVAENIDHTFKRGDVVHFDSEYAVIREIDPTRALFLLECQDGGFIWEFPEEVRHIRKDDYPRMFWRIKPIGVTPEGQVRRYKFWIGPHFGKCTGSFMRGYIHPVAGFTIRQVKQHVEKTLKAYTEGRV